MLQSLSYQHSVTLEPLNQISGFQLTGQDTNIRTFINIKAVLQHIRGFGKLLSGRCVQKYKLPFQDGRKPGTGRLSLNPDVDPLSQDLPSITASSPCAHTGKWPGKHGEIMVAPY